MDSNKKGLGIVGKITATIVAVGIGIAGTLGLAHDAEKNHIKKENTRQISIEFMNKTDNALKNIEANIKTLKTRKFFSITGPARYPTYSDFIDAQNVVGKNIFPNIIIILNEVAEKKDNMSRTQKMQYSKKIKELRDYMISRIAKPVHCKNINGDGTTPLSIDVTQSVEALNQAIAILTK